LKVALFTIFTSDFDIKGNPSAREICWWQEAKMHHWQRGGLQYHLIFFLKAGTVEIGWN